MTEASDRLQADVEAAVADGLHASAILDPASFAQTWQRFGDLAIGRGGGSVFSGTPQPQDTRVAPLLLPLQPGDASTLAALTQVALAAPAVVWLASPLPVRALADRLSDKLYAELADGARAITLRYYDPRVLPELQRVLSPHQCRHLNDGVSIWWWFDRRNELATLQSDKSAVRSTTMPPGLKPAISLDDGQVDALLAASFADRVIDILRRSSPQLLQGFDQAACHAVTHQLVTEAAAWRLEAEFDCASYVALALEQGPDFASRANWIDIMSAVKAGELGFGDAIVEWERQHADTA